MTYKKAVVLAAGVLMAAGAASPAMADSVADGQAIGSPGVLSGNLVQVPVHVPVNVCGNTVNVVGLLNPAFGNTCVNA
ncbi:chaplin [Streptomyces sp. NBC_01006]|uniref:chaplin n=1 Tax=Streptomyces sp. NBC_01006 TaxID=2903716 RepID=UPI003865611E